MIFLKVPGGDYQIGTTREGVAACVDEWKQKLINPCYNERVFQEWIEKEFPAHRVSVDGFEMSRTLVTNAEAKKFLAEVNLAAPESLREPDDHPVWGVSLEWASQFAAWKSRQEAEFVYRLPTETEWEIAARGEDFREYPYGAKFNPSAANTIESQIGGTTPVGRYGDYPGPFGHLDLAGNVEEWVSTSYFVYEGGRVIEDDLFQRFGLDYPILRGGSFCCGGDLSRSARRHGPFPDPLFRFTGFRLVREANRSLRPLIIKTRIHPKSGG